MPAGAGQAYSWLPFGSGQRQQLHVASQRNALPAWPTRINMMPGVEATDVLVGLMRRVLRKK
ncbi:hypothetical protein RugamoR1_38560 [Rugamonas sp. R1(2021)]